MLFHPPHGLRPRGHGLAPDRGRACARSGRRIRASTPWRATSCRTTVPRNQEPEPGIAGRHLYPVIKPGAPPDPGCCRGIAGRSVRQSGGAGPGVPGRRYGGGGKGRRQANPSGFGGRPGRLLTVQINPHFGRPPCGLTQGTHYASLRVAANRVPSPFFWATTHF